MTGGEKIMAVLGALVLILQFWLTLYFSAFTLYMIPDFLLVIATGGGIWGFAILLYYPMGFLVETVGKWRRS